MMALHSKMMALQDEMMDLQNKNGFTKHNDGFTKPNDGFTKTRWNQAGQGRKQVMLYKDVSTLSFALHNYGFTKTPLSKNTKIRWSRVVESDGAGWEARRAGRSHLLYKMTALQTTLQSN
jgi:hypothetical protein